MTGECMCTPAGQCGNCWERKDVVRSRADVMEESMRYQHGQGGSWEDLLNEDERAYVAMMRRKIAQAREEYLASRTRFDRLCDDLYLFGRRIRAQDGRR